MSNQAAWIKEAKAGLTIDAAEIPTLGPNELLIKNAVIALNPFDAKVQKLALLPLPYPNILGTSYAGIVEKVGSSITAFKPGDRVVNNRSRDLWTNPVGGAFQKYVLADSRTTSKIEDNTSFDAAAATIANLGTVASALSIYMKLDRPNPNGPNPANREKKILIYGGSSSLGGFAVHYAVRAGYTVITTSSPHNAPTMSSLKPAKIVDHTQPVESMVEDLKAAGPYDAIFDTIGTAPATAIIGKVLADNGGEFYTTGPPLGPLDLPDNVQRNFRSFPGALLEPENEEIRVWFYGTLGKYLGLGLADKLIAPERLEQITGGLEGIQKGLDMLIKGVSGKKLVVKL